jgi:acyl-CoA dehydrogenase
MLSTAISFLEEDCLPGLALYHQQIPPSGPERWTVIPPVLETLKTRAKEVGLWNLWLSGGEFQHLAGGSGAGLSNLEYAVIAEISAHASRLMPEAMNCSAPDTGNMEVIARFGTQAQKDRYLYPLVNGKIRSAFSMTEYGSEYQSLILPTPFLSY